MRVKLLKIIESLGIDMMSFKSGILLLILFLCVGCSKEQVMYRYGDWLLERKILEYAKFNRDQRKELEKISTQYMLWHEEKMLPTYLTTLAEIKKSIEKRQVDEKKISLLNNAYQETFLELFNRMTPLLSEMNQSQVDVLQKKILMRQSSQVTPTLESMTLANRAFFVDLVGRSPKKEELKELRDLSKSQVQRHQEEQVKYGKTIQSFLSCFYEEDKKRCFLAYKKLLSSNLILFDSKEVKAWGRILNSLNKEDQRKVIRTLDKYIDLIQTLDF